MQRISFSPHFLFAVAASVLAAIQPAPAFDGETTTEAPLVLSIGAVPVVTEREHFQTVTLALANAGAEALSVRLRVPPPAGDGRIEEPGEKTIRLEPQGAATTTFAFAMGKSAVSGLYPFHVRASFRYGGQECEAHAVRIFETRLEASAPVAPAPPPPVAVPGRGALSLASLTVQRVAWQFFDQPLVEMPAGWTGTDPDSGTDFRPGPVDRPDTRLALAMHPPWRGAAGTMFVDYPLRLPATTPLRFEFRHAIRDSVPAEGASDGVTFRVRVGDEVLFERHSDAKAWQPASVDLARFAGRDIVLRLETHPGPQRNTTCDAAFWGDPVVVSGSPPPVLDEAARETLRMKARRAALYVTSGDGVFVLGLSEGKHVAVAPGPNGLADAALAFAVGDQSVVLDGFAICLADQALGGWPSAAVVENVSTKREGERVVIDHRVQVQGAPATVTATIETNGPSLRVKIASDARLTAIHPGPADQRATRVFYGHGYCIEEPGRFSASGGGHDLATSHVGVDFANGLSLLTACDTPPDAFDVDPGRRLYALRTHPDSTFTFVAGNWGALPCAIDFRSLDRRQAAPGVAAKAGRFVFDLWGGRYADLTAKLERCFRYGLTDSLVVVHDWQRWGYDYRLPDIFPPNPALGTTADLRQLGELCARHGVRWGLHDNYIDIYPDADGFNYDHVTFHPDGRPRQAWLNEGRDAQSYQFRPDHVRPFLEHNLALIKPALRPTASFVDVWTSLNAFDYHDRQGAFHSKMETLRCWGDNFALIRDTLGDNAPTISEAGSDQLVGRLDGADCQFLRLSPDPRPFALVRPCRDWERVPWFDAVLHSRFSLHGVGYSGRYQGWLPRESHGIESDDYLSSEILTGHALMVDAGCLVRGAVRKYWLAQAIAGSLRADAIRRVDFVDGDIHRQTVSWQSGAQVWVNRGATDWDVERHTLPPFGFLARAGSHEASIERIDGLVVERSKSPGTAYANGRTYLPGLSLDIRPTADRIDHLGGRDFRLVVNWQAGEPAAQDLTVFYHFTRRPPGGGKEIAFCPGGDPDPPTSRWSGQVATGANWQFRLPDSMGPGEYSILVGLYDRKGDGSRALLSGDDDGTHRYRLGRMIVDGEDKPGGAIHSIRLVPEAGPVAVGPRANPRPTDFGYAVAGGGFRITAEARSLVVTPLPDGADFPLVLRPTRFLDRSARATRVEAIAADGKPVRAVDFESDADSVRFTVSRADFAYRIAWE